MADTNSKSFVDSMVEAQKQMVDTVVENSKQYAGGNNVVKEAAEKGGEWYKKWLETQKTIFTNTSEKVADAASHSKENASKMNEFYQNWFNTQMSWAKQMWEMNMNYMKNATQQNNVSTDPAAIWNNFMNSWTTNWNNWMNNMYQAAQWNEMMNKWQNMNPYSADAWKKATENWTGIFNQYYEMLNSGFANLQKNMENGTTQDAYRNMVNVSEAFTRFSEMWMPFWKSIQEKTFNTGMFKEWANPAMYKDLMDKYFGFMPEESRQYVQNMTKMMQENMARMNQAGMGNYQQVRNMMGNFIPSNGEYFSTLMNNYNAFSNMMSEAAAPFTKMVTPNQYTKAISEWSEIANRMAVYNIKNAELQYMVYTHGSKVMDKLAEAVTQKVEKGEEISSIMNLYQEWLNISDKTFVELFESEEYSKLMAEVSAMQLTLRKEVEQQLEKFMVGVPVATRSEMDELYKTIYELKKQVRELQKANNTEDSEEATEKKSRSKKS